MHVATESRHSEAIRLVAPSHTSSHNFTARVVCRSFDVSQDLRVDGIFTSRPDLTDDVCPRCHAIQAAHIVILPIDGTLVLANYPINGQTTHTETSSPADRRLPRMASYGKACNNSSGQ